jgi:hypothetical protein
MFLILKHLQERLKPSPPRNTVVTEEKMSAKEIAARIVTRILIDRHDAKKIEEATLKLEETLIEIHAWAFAEGAASMKLIRTPMDRKVTYGLPCDGCGLYSPSGEACAVCEGKKNRGKKQ